MFYLFNLSMVSMLHLIRAYLEFYLRLKRSLLFLIGSFFDSLSVL